MDIDKAREILGSAETDFSEKNRIFLGMQILNGFSADLPMNFEHDQVWTCNFEETVKKMDEDTVKTMGRYGWFESEDSWSHFD